MRGSSVGKSVVAIGFVWYYGGFSYQFVKTFSYRPICSDTMAFIVVLFPETPDFDVTPVSVLCEGSLNAYVPKCRMMAHWQKQAEL